MKRLQMRRCACSLFQCYIAGLRNTFQYIVDRLSADCHVDVEVSERSALWTSSSRGIPQSLTEKPSTTAHAYLSTPFVS